ncbi:MAG: hydrolase [Candidatus Altiarchaeota archaeon]
MTLKFTTEKIRREIAGLYERKYLKVPKVIKKARGFKLRGRTIRSITNSTDPVIARNNNADALMMVYPFTPDPVIVQSFIRLAQRPVFVGVGGGTTTGKKVAHIALNAEFMGAGGVIVNSPISKKDIERIIEYTDLPVIATLVDETQLDEKVSAGAHVINVAAGKRTRDVVEAIDDNCKLPIIASGGPSDETILATIEAGADAVTYTPPPISLIMGELMDKYREMV